MVVTLGGDGALVLEPGAPAAHVPPRPATVRDTTGAGDTFNGVLAVRLAAGDPLADAVDVASAAAALSVGEVGARAGMPDAAAIEAATTATPGHTARGGVRSRVMKLEGLHHITAITGDAPRNVEFYVGVLGLRMVKKTVNQDDPSVYHLFYADEAGSPGADLTFFEYPGAQPGRAGAGMVHRIAHRVGSEAALGFWEERLGGAGAEPVRTDGALRFRDPEGLEHELVVATVPDAPLTAKAPDVPPEHALQGFDGVRAYARDPERSAPLLRDTLGFESREDGTWELRGDERGGLYRYDPPPPERPLPGRGHRAPRRLVVADGRAGRLAAPRRDLRRAADARDRPLLVPLDLLPRAQRRAVRARHDGAGVHDGRGSRAPGRAPRAAAALRAAARPGGADAHAAAGPAGTICSVALTPRNANASS